MAKKVKVNADACIGCGLCISTAPEVFAFTDDGKSEVIYRRRQLIASNVPKRWLDYTTIA